MTLFQQTWLYDISSNIDEVTDFLGDLYDRLVGCQKRAAEFKGYQKQFRVIINYIVYLEIFVVLI